MRNGLFISPGVRISEIDQSIVPDLYSQGQHNVLIFVQSDWGPSYKLIENGTKEFQKYFGLPSNINSVSKISYDQQYRLQSKNCNLWIFRLNQSTSNTDYQNYEIDIDPDTYTPVIQKYTGQYGNTLRLKFSTITSQIKTLYVMDVYTQNSNLTDPILLETFSGRSIEDVIILANRSSEFITVNSEDLDNIVWQQLVSQSQTSLLSLTGGENGSRIDPTTYITEEILENSYEFKFTFLVNQAQLYANEIQYFVELQYRRKDFVILSEIIPEQTSDLDDNEDVNGIPQIGWYNWFKYVTSNVESLGSLPGYTYRYPTGLSQSYLQIYNPWVLDNSIDQTLIPYPPSVHVMETFLQVLANGGELWEQMAGLNRGNISAEPITILSKLDSDLLYLNNVNPIVKFQGQGTYIWGQKTHYMRNSQLSRLNARMVAIHIETGIQEKMRQFLFEPMTNQTFSQIENSINIFMTSVQSRNGITQYQYELDTRPEFIERNYLPIKIRFIPVKSLEFIEIRFVVKNYSQTL